MFEIKNVSVRFGGSNVQAVDGVSLTLPERSRTAIIGETGSGKSVLLLAILRLLPPNAEVRGSVTLNGEELLEATGKRLQQIRGGEISYVPQGGGGSLNPLLRIGDQVGEPLRQHRGFSKAKAFLASIPLLQRFNLEKEHAYAYPHMLSGGMRQRAMLGMGVAGGARILLADEPTKGLDPRRVDMVVEALGKLREETLLCVTHDINFAAAVADSICVMYAAQQLETAPAEELLTHPLHPYTQDMLRAMPENEMVCSEAGFAPPHDAYGDTGCRYRHRCAFCREVCKKMPPMTDLGGHQVRCWKYADDNGKPL